MASAISQACDLTLALVNLISDGLLISRFTTVCAGYIFIIYDRCSQRRPLDWYTGASLVLWTCTGTCIYILGPC